MVLANRALLLFSQKTLAKNLKTMTLSRLFNPKSIAIIGGGVWCKSVAEQAIKMGFKGKIFPIHPKRKPLVGIASFAELADLPYPPDDCFIGVHRFITLDVVSQLSTMGAGGAICFASGFSEAKQEDNKGMNLQTRLVAAAGDMPILGPNWRRCIGHWPKLRAVIFG